MTKRELFYKAMRKEAVPYMPVGFWCHFIPGAYGNEELTDEGIREKRKAGAEAFARGWSPDFVKAMTDGLFYLPYSCGEITEASQLLQIEPVAMDDPWVQKSIACSRDYRAVFGEDMPVFYNVFAPFAHLVSALSADPRASIGKLMAFVAADPETVAQALMKVADNLCDFLRLLAKEGQTDGIYFSGSNGKLFSQDILRKVICPADIKVLSCAKELFGDNILHICGYGGKNHLDVYQDYPVSAISIAVHTDDITLAGAQEMFPDAMIIGGMDNTPDGALYNGPREAIEEEVRTCLDSVDRSRFILGADCTLMADTDPAHLTWAQEAARK